MKKIQKIKENVEIIIGIKCSYTNGKWKKLGKCHKIIFPSD